MNKIRIALPVLFSALLLGACTFVPLNPGAEKVTQVKLDHIQTCSKLGSTTVNVMEKMGLIERTPESVQENLVTLAKNNAISMDGDTIVAADSVVGGRQTFLVYKCKK